MAFGDLSEGTVIEARSATVALVEFTSGPRAGTTWHVRTHGTAAAPPIGPAAIEGISNLHWVRGEIPSGSRIQVTEDGLGWHGRLIGEMHLVDRAATWDNVLLASPLRVVTVSGPGGFPPGPITYSAPWLTWGTAGRIEIDGVEPQ